MPILGRMPPVPWRHRSSGEWLFASPESFQGRQGSGVVVDDFHPALASGLHPGLDVITVSRIDICIGICPEQEGDAHPFTKKLVAINIHRHHVCGDVLGIGRQSRQVGFHPFVEVEAEWSTNGKGLLKVPGRFRQ